jgi:pimeloyl-ACP methyl ester carboxylesterase
MNLGRIFGAVGVIVGLFAIGGCLAHRKLLYFPSHDGAETDLTPWKVGGQVVGFASTRERPTGVWLMLHGNGGQASHRGYVLPRMRDSDALYVMEYPGYGQRMGSPSRDAFNTAAAEALAALRGQFPDLPIGVIGESIGSGPASWLGGQLNPPDKIVLMVPFDRLERVAKEKFPWLPVGLVLRDKWENAVALANYPGPVEIYGATDDQIIPVQHAKDLATKLPRAKFTLIPGGHNAWSYQEALKIRFRNEREEVN